MARPKGSTNKSTHAAWSAGPPATIPQPKRAESAVPSGRGRRKGQVVNRVMVARRKLLAPLKREALYDLASDKGIPKPFLVPREQLIEHVAGSWDAKVTKAAREAFNIVVKRAESDPDSAEATGADDEGDE